MRNTVRLSIFTVVVIVGSGCATPETQLAGDYVAASGEGVVTRECRFAKWTGSKMRERICYAPEVWARIDAVHDEGQDTDEFFRRVRESAASAAEVGASPAGP